MLSIFTRQSSYRGRWDLRVLCAGLSLLAAALVPAGLLVPAGPAQAQSGQKAPELLGGAGWLGTDHPLTLEKDLRGKIVILEFWTEC